MAVPNGGGSQDTTRQGTGWWGWNRQSGWDDQGCLGCGLAWWIVALCCFVIFGFWGWGVPGWGGWGGWGWRHNYGSANYGSTNTGSNNCQCPPGSGQTGQTNMQPGSGAPSAAPATNATDAGPNTR